MRRNNSPFNLSLLDLLTAALGAVIFLFIITPKGGVGAATTQQASIFFDTTTMKIHGLLPDSLKVKNAGDTLFAMLVGYRPEPNGDADKLAAALEAERQRAQVAEQDRQQALAAQTQAEQRRLRAEEEARRADAARKAAEREASRKPAVVSTPTKKPDPSPPVVAEPKPAVTTPKPDPAYRGTPPSVPARMSLELKWADAGDNVDLFVCQGTTCVYGNNKRVKSIGQWDSGKSRNRIFGNDLRTNQEAVRQFDELLPGTYTIYAMFKESDKGRQSVKVEGLIYTKDKAGKPRGKTYQRTLKRGDTRTRLITVTIKADGTFTTR